MPTVQHPLVECVQADIAAQEDIDAVVNAANAQLQTGGGVAGALHRAAGPELARAGEAQAPIRPGQAVITAGFNLPNTHVIHCLGPVYGMDEPSAELLASCYRQALELAEQHGIQRIAFPALSTGAFGYPMEEATEIAVSTVLTSLATCPSIQLVRFVLFDKASLAVHQRWLEQLTDGEN
ncbi:macro domain-containing protein [Halomonas huangheensis]|uniref:Macro domain-containing protein n=1 Tax=Halomonas huangheensis TaxID=1178482 RepID=W1NAA6_9GAMM|nr:macro domain-containing protein [Halomonas huangheensis]ALM53486.1 RNase III inhibitor [Halomonas huangheensis]ERL51835.1 hypothetical protein BJB45_11765 [Halomonas huangheensis]